MINSRKIKFNPNKEEFILKYKELESSKKMAELYGVNNKTILKYADSIGYKNNKTCDYWKPENKEEFISIYNKLKSSIKVAEYYGVCKKTILKYAKRIGYKNKYRNELSAEEIKYVLSNYNLKTSINLAKELNVSKSYITKIWRENNLSGKQTRRYYLNENYFEVIDTNDKAYILGVIASDGCVYKREHHVGVLSFTFHIQEKDIIDILIKYIKLEYKEHTTENRISLQINSDKIVSDLKKYNITPRKTWIYSPYILKDDSLMWAYIRGYFDGDGSIYYANKKENTPSSYEISFCGNKNTMNFFNNFFHKFDIKSYIHKDNRRKYSQDFYIVRIKENKSKSKFIKYLYENCKDVKLNRKYNKCMKFLEIYNKRLSN